MSTQKVGAARVAPRLTDDRTDDEHVGRDAALQHVNEDRGLVLDDLLVEDVSIDGMCGVY